MTSCMKSFVVVGAYIVAARLILIAVTTIIQIIAIGYNVVPGIVNTILGIGAAVLMLLAIKDKKPRNVIGAFIYLVRL